MENRGQINIFCGMFCEAAPLIKAYDLKRNTTYTAFQIFEKEELPVRVIIMGVGMISAATAVGTAAVWFEFGKNDIIINLGCAATVGLDHTGCNDKNATDDQDNGKVYLCNKLTDISSSRCFYPDIIYKHPFEEAELFTGASVYDNKKGLPAGIEADEIKGAKALYDMEGAALYQAAAHFVGPHQMYFIKVISDNGKSDISPKYIEGLIGEKTELIKSFVEELITISEEQLQEDILSEQGKIWFDKLKTGLHCSRTMEAELLQQLKYQELSGKDYISELQTMEEQELIPCKDKREGKKIFEEIKKRFL